MEDNFPRIADIVDTNLYKYDDRISQKTNQVSAYDITISHELGAKIEVTQTAMVSQIVTSGNLTRMIILKPIDDIVYIDRAFEVEDILSANQDGYVLMDIIEIPSDFSGVSAYPNPFNPQTSIRGWTS